MDELHKLEEAVFSISDSDLVAAGQIASSTLLWLGQKNELEDSERGLALLCLAYRRLVMEAEVNEGVTIH